jgi:predicted enzyme related to lactoylglutathione lyase
MTESTTTATAPRPSDGVVRPRLDLVVLDCPDATALGAFYAELLGWGIEEGSEDDWVTLEPPGGHRPDNPSGWVSLAFQQVEDYQPPTWPTGPRPQHFHLDFEVPDIDAAEAVVVAAGATVHEHQPSETGSFRVFLDPAGHPFCLCRS